MGMADGGEVDGIEALKYFHEVMGLPPLDDGYAEMMARLNMMRQRPPYPRGMTADQLAALPPGDYGAPEIPLSADEFATGIRTGGGAPQYNGDIPALNAGISPYFSTSRANDRDIPYHPPLSAGVSPYPPDGWSPDLPMMGESDAPMALPFPPGAPYPFEGQPSTTYTLDNTQYDQLLLPNEPFDEMSAYSDPGGAPGSENILSEVGPQGSALDMWQRRGRNQLRCSDEAAVAPKDGASWWESYDPIGSGSATYWMVDRPDVAGEYENRRKEGYGRIPAAVLGSVDAYGRTFADLNRPVQKAVDQMIDWGFGSRMVSDDPAGGWGLNNEELDYPDAPAIEPTKPGEKKSPGQKKADSSTPDGQSDVGGTGGGLSSVASPRAPVTSRLPANKATSDEQVEDMRGAQAAIDKMEEDANPYSLFIKQAMERRDRAAARAREVAGFTTAAMPTSSGMRAVAGGMLAGSNAYEEMMGQYGEDMKSAAGLGDQMTRTGLMADELDLKREEMLWDQAIDKAKLALARQRAAGGAGLGSLSKAFGDLDSKDYREDAERTVQNMWPEYAIGSPQYTTAVYTVMLHNRMKLLSMATGAPFNDDLFEEVGDDEAEGEKGIFSWMY
jgi:hypothetical protein